jgi:hypothetical protein
MRPPRHADLSSRRPSRRWTRWEIPCPSICRPRSLLLPAAKLPPAFLLRKARTQGLRESSIWGLLRILLFFFAGSVHRTQPSLLCFLFGSTHCFRRAVHVHSQEKNKDITLYRLLNDRLPDAQWRVQRRSRLWRENNIYKQWKLVVFWELHGNNKKVIVVELLFSVTSRK